MTEVIKFMSDHYAAKRSVFAYVAIFYKSKRHEGESVNDYMVRLRQLAVPCNFGANLEKELLRAFVFGCGIEKVEELMSSNDSKTLKDAIECGLKNDHNLEDLKQIRSAYSLITLITRSRNNPPGIQPKIAAGVVEGSTLS